MANFVKHRKLLDAITLESTAVATQAIASRVEFDSDDCCIVWLSVTYTVGATETNNTASVYLEVFDGFTWIPFGVTTNTAGTATMVPVHYDIVGASAGTYTGIFPVNVGLTASSGFVLGKLMRVSALESGVATNKGTITVVAMAR